MHIEIAASHGWTIVPVISSRFLPIYPTFSIKLSVVTVLPVNTSNNICKLRRDILRETILCSMSNIRDAKCRVAKSNASKRSQFPKSWLNKTKPKKKKKKKKITSWNLINGNRRRNSGMECVPAFIWDWANSSWEVWAPVWPMRFPIW